MQHAEVRETFDYDALEEETRVFVLQKTMETHGLLKRTAEHIIQIGQNLLSIKASLDHGQFEPWLQAEFTMTARHARRFMLVAERFGEKADIMSVFPVTILYELASPSTSESVLAQVEGNQIPATLDAIRAAKESERQARVSQEELEELQEQLAQEREAATTQIGQLSLELERVQGELARLSAPPAPQIKEFPVVPPEVSARLGALQNQVRALTAQRDELVQQAAKLEERVQVMAPKWEEERYMREIRLAWSNATAALHTSLLKFLTQFPTAQQAQAYTATDWNRLTQIQVMYNQMSTLLTPFSDSNFHFWRDRRKLLCLQRNG